MIEEIEKIDEKIDQINSSLDDIENKNTKMDQRFRIVLYHFWSTVKNVKNFLDIDISQAIYHMYIPGIGDQ